MINTATYTYKSKKNLLMNSFPFLLHNISKGQNESVVYINKNVIDKITLNNIIVFGKSYSFKKPYIITPLHFEDKKYKFHYVDSNINIDILATDIESLKNQFIEEFEMLILQYFLEDDSNLTYDAIDLKNRISSLLEEWYGI